MPQILIIEDDEVFGEILVMHLEDQGHEVLLARSLAQAKDLLCTDAPSAILLDQQLPDGYGLDLLREIVGDASAPPVVMITGVSDNTLAIEAMAEGAFDFIRKPMDKVELDTTLANALRTHRLSRQISAITDSADYRVDVNQIVGSSPAILQVCKTIGAVAARNAPVLITGETGTGKEVIARAIHHHSGRKGLFLPINCSALTATLLESELFGHEKGSFTGAVVRKEGKIELADEGTLFLDELGEMPAALQAKLLRVLQEGSFERVGGTQSLHADARIIAATHRDLKTMVAEGDFREDIYYRLNVVHIHLPPLRERLEDLPLLVEHLLGRINAKQHTAVKQVTERAWNRIRQYRWPGNIRELDNVLTRAVVLARTDTITPELLSLPEETTASPPARAPLTGHAAPLRLITLEELEREHISAILEHLKWHKGKACKILGISRPSLERRIERYGL
jgi:DNA-binding NtrC family response regulator